MIENRSEQVVFRLSPTELAMLTRIAEEEGERIASILRRMIRKEHGRRFGETTKATSKKNTKH